MDIDELFEVFDQNTSHSNSNSTDVIIDDTVKNGKFSDNEELLKSICDERNKRKSIENELETEETSIAKKQKLAFEDISVEECLTRIKVHKVEAVEGCLHEVAVPHDSEYAPLEPISPDAIPAKIYPFILDPFQKEAILCLENTQSVLVSAHTSAGKTVIAEYAIAMSLRSKQRVVYTTPIKALSNQKYREFYEEFKDVGLMTGDVTINPSASCLIMTTEILRSMLYRGSEVMKEVGWVIFDEIHYMRDKERGVVWEETIILLPDNVHYVFLSATIPNAIQFAEWICYLHKQPCHVVYTEYRPVPLQHYIFPAGGQGLHLVVDEIGNFQEENFNKAMSVLQNPEAEGGFRRRRNAKPNKDCYNLVQMIMEMNFAPVIVFSFRRKECETYGVSISRLDFNTEKEKQAVEEIFNNALDVLSEEDRKLPQVEHVLPLLKRGIGIHHSGLLPILKETVEILFSEGLIKALFATETFAMGLNMPARTVMFTTARKFDGRDMRYLSSSEYIQMSGRAGRRGLDDRGIVILMVDEKMDSKAAKQIIKGQTDPLNSAFHLSYNMILNLLRVDGINPEYMMQRSFYQFQNHAAIPHLQSRLKELMEQHNSIEIENEPEVASYYLIRQNLEALAKEFQQYIVKPQYCVPFLQPGRMVKVKRGDIDFGWGIIINYQKKFGPPKNESPSIEALYIVDVMLHLSKQSIKTGHVNEYRPVEPGQKGEMLVFPIKLNLISQFSAVKLYYPQDLRPYENRMTVLKSIQAIEKKFPKGVPLLDPIEDLKITEKAFLDLVKRIKTFEDRMKQHELHHHPDLENILQLYTQKAKLGNEIKELATELRQKKTLLQMDDLNCRKRVLRRLGYCTQADVVELKGRVGCEISCANEILLTEMLFHNLFNDLTPAQIAALISCFVCQENSNEFPKLSEDLCGPLRKMQELARMIARVSVEARLEMDEQSFVETFKPFLMDVVYSWCKGASFSSICKLTDVFEGTIIRAMRREEELLRQMTQAAKTIGNKDLEEKFSESIKLMKRGIVFSASLYL